MAAFRKPHMDLLNKYLKGCSPYIHQLTYNLVAREFTLVCAKSIGDWVPHKGIRFTDVISFSENCFEDILDDNGIDSVVGMHKVSDGVYCLNTEKREIVLKVGVTPNHIEMTS